MISVSIFGQEIDPNGRNVFYYENGRIASEGNFKNGLPEGIWKNYYSDGTLRSIGKKEKGLSDSLWTFYDLEGRKAKEFEYANDMKNGYAIYFDTSFFILKKVFFVNDTAQGKKITYYPDGAIRSTVELVDGKEIGVLVEYSKTGEIITEEIYDNGYLKDRKIYNRFDKNGNKTGVWRTFFPTGIIESEINYKEGKKNGLSKKYNKKGKLIDLSKMVGDTIAGHKNELVIIEMYKDYHLNGKEKLIGGLDNGLKNGIFREYNETGEIINGFIYEKDTLIAEGIITGLGILQGDWVYYYKSGVVKSKGNYSDSKKEGKWIYYYADGKKEQEGVLKNNQLSGKWIWYYQNSQVKREEFYNRKELLEGTVFEYDSLGNEMTKGDYYNGLKEGDWFYHVGDYKEVGEFTLGFENGRWNYYYLNGKLAFEGTFDEGEPKGKHIYYHENGLQKEVGKYLGGEKHGKWKTYNKKGEKIKEIEYKRGEIYKIDGSKAILIKEED